MAAGSYDTVLRGGVVVNHDGVRQADVAIRDGVVAVIAQPGAELSAEETVDVSGKHLFPGVVDPHAHVTTNRRPIADYIARETPTLALGGVTTLIDFSGCLESYHAHVPSVIQDIEQHSYIDMGLHAILMTEEHLRELEAYRSEYGVTSFKMFFAAGGARLYPMSQAVDDGFLFRALRKIASLPGMVAMVHAENWEIARALAAELEAAGRTDPAAWTDSRPNVCEVEGLTRAAVLALETGAPLYAVHLSTRQAPEILREYRARGARLFAETCPQYLMIYREHPLAQLAKYNPAIKRKEDNEVLWQAVMDGAIDSIGSDHIPVRKTDKVAGNPNIWAAHGGVPGSGTILPLLLSEGVAKRGMSLERVAAVSSYNTARLFGLHPRKGAIAVGSDADIVVSDLKRKVTVTPDLLNVDFTLFDGQEFTGWPEMTMLRGRVIARNGTLTSDASWGRYLRR